MNKTNIDWPGLTHTLNPVTGCLRGCSYCYAQKLHTMRHNAYLEGKKLPRRYQFPFNKIHYWPETFDTVPMNPKKPTKIFIGSMSDICYWDDYHIQETIDFCGDYQNIEFMFLTKQCDIYHGWKWPENCQLGFTAEIPSNGVLKASIDKMAELKSKTFISVEPLVGMGCEIPEEIDLVIVGAMTGPKAITPKKEWIDSIKHPNIHYKDNIRKYL